MNTLPLPRRQAPWSMAVMILFGLACGGIDLAAPEASEEQPSSKRSAGWEGPTPQRIAIGTCLRRVPLSSPLAVSCDEPHDDEVFAEYAIPSPRPDGDALDDTAQTACIRAFDDYVGIAYDDSQYSVAWQIGDQVMTCLLFAREPTRGAARGAKR